MFRIGEIEDDASSSASVLTATGSRCSREELVCGNFDPDDVDFAANASCSRASSSSSLRRGASSRSSSSIAKFYLGHTACPERHPSGHSASTCSSYEPPPSMSSLPFHSCHSCGVQWDQDQFCFDCAECGGYAQERECPECGGQCRAQWHRDFEASHERHRAVWRGHCRLSHSPAHQSLLDELHDPGASAAVDHLGEHFVRKLF